MLGRHVARNRIDHITTSFEVLTETFGPHGSGDEDKTMAQWDIITPKGWAEIYDFHDPHESPEDVEVWHVQAASEEGFEYVYEAIRDTASRLGSPSGLGES
jgi:hypothetical protein